MSAAWTDCFEVTVEGRQFRVGKRPGQANFSVRVERNRKQIVKSLRTPHPKTARKNAEHFLTAVLREDWAAIEKLRARDGNARVERMLEIYEARAARALRVDAKTARQNANAMRALVMDGLAVKDVGESRVTVLTDELVRRYVIHARERGLSDASIGSTITKARSVVKPEALELYRELNLPEFAKFREVAVTLDKGDQSFVPFPPGVAGRMERAARLLFAQAKRGGKWSRNVWLAYTLMGRAGLRNSEIANEPEKGERDERTGKRRAVRIAAMGWHWFVEIPSRDGVKRCVAVINRPEENFEVKNGLPRQVELHEDVWAQVMELKGDRKGMVIEAESMTERWNFVNREINRFVRVFLPDRTKGAYELRKWAGSVVCTVEFGRSGSTQSAIFAAQQFLGHKSYSTTERHYVKFLGQIRGVSSADALRWAM